MSLEEEMSNPSDEEIISILHQRLQTAKEELQAYKEDRFCQGGCAVYQFDKIKQLKEENENLTIQNRHLNTALGARANGKKTFIDLAVENDTLTKQLEKAKGALGKHCKRCNSSEIGYCRPDNCYIFKALEELDG